MLQTEVFEQLTLESGNGRSHHKMALLMTFLGLD